MRRPIVRVALVLALVVALSSCAAGPNDVAGAGQLDGFWQGLWHGFISPFAFIVSLFKDGVGIYEVHNNGNWYNFGFLIGASVIFSGPTGSGAAARRRRSGRAST
jgi:predicted small secreted protein